LTYEDDIEISDNTITCFIGDIDEVKSIGSDMGILKLYAEKKDKNKCLVWLVNTHTGKKETPQFKLKIDEIGDILKPRNNIHKYIKGHMGVKELRHDVYKTLSRFCAVVADTFKYDPPIRSIPDPPTHSDINPDEALEFLKNPDIIEEINKILEISIKGEKITRFYVFLCVLQSFTKEYLQVTLVAESSAGKTWISNRVLDLFPEENVKKVGRMSKTIIERSDIDPNIKILYVQEKRGSRPAIDTIRLSSMSDQGMVAWIVNRDTHKGEELKVKPMSIITTTTDLDMETEDATRNIKISLDHTIEQTKKVIDFQAHQAEFPPELQHLFNWIDLDKLETIKNAIRLLDKNIDVIIPFQSEVGKLLDKSKIRIKRDHKKVIGHIKTLTLLRQYQRECLYVDDKRWLIATIEDFEDALKYSEKQITSTYYNVDDDMLKIIDIIKEIENGKSWVEDFRDTRHLGTHTDEIIVAVEEKLNRKRTWTTDRLKYMRENSIISGTWQKLKNAKSGYYYKTIDKKFESFLIEKPDRDKLTKRIEEWKNIILSQQGHDIKFEKFEKG